MARPPTSGAQFLRAAGEKGTVTDAPNLKNAMTPFPFSVEAAAPIEHAIEFMREHKIRHLPVTSKGALTSLVTVRDIKLVLGPDFSYPRDIKVRVEGVADPANNIVNKSTADANIKMGAL